MNKQTLKALKGSIKKWELIIAGDGMDNGTDNCPLCASFHSRKSLSNGMDCCAGCPVSEHTGEAVCENTPYIDWLENQTGNSHPFTANTPETKKAARAELKFLKSLLP